MPAVPLQTGLPTLIPNFDQPVQLSPGITTLVTAAQFISNNPRTNATVTATIGGTITAGDILPLVITCGTLPGGSLAIVYTVQASDTTTTIAEEFERLINTNATAQSVGMFATTGSTPATSNVVTINWNGPVGNFAVASTPPEDKPTVTIAGTAATGHTLNVLFTGGTFASPVLVTAASTTGNTATQQAAAVVTAITGNSQLSGAGITATNTAGVITVTIPAGQEPMNLSAFPNPVNPFLATIGGTTFNVGDTLAVTITNATLPSGAVTVTYTVQAGDTTATSATGLFNLINANTALIAAGITATNGTPSVASISYPPAIGAMSFSQAVTGTGNETITLSSAAAETMSVGTSATETITLGNGGVFAGGSGPVIPGQNAELTYNGSNILLWYGKPRILDYNLLAAMVNQGINVV